MIINTKKLQKTLEARQYGPDDEVECYCPSCENLVTFDNTDVACPFFDPECYHDGWKCNACGAEYDFMEGIPVMVDYNKERSISEKIGNKWLTREELKERKNIPHGFDKCKHCNTVANFTGGRCSNCYL